MYRSSPLRSTLNTSCITGLDMCEACAEAVHSVAAGTRVTSQWLAGWLIPPQWLAGWFRRSGWLAGWIRRQHEMPHQWNCGIKLWWTLKSRRWHLTMFINGRQNMENIAKLLPLHWNYCSRGTSHRHSCKRKRSKTMFQVAPPATTFAQLTKDQPCHIFTAFWLDVQPTTRKNTEKKNNCKKGWIITKRRWSFCFRMVWWYFPGILVFDGVQYFIIWVILLVNHLTMFSHELSWRMKVPASHS